MNSNRKKRPTFGRLRSRLAFALAVLCLVSVMLTGAVAALEPYGNGLSVRNWLVNDKHYKFSDAYKTSVWYENFTALSLTGNERYDVIRIALSQMGYHEGDSAEDFDGYSTNGADNYTEYCRLLVPAYNDNHYEWCACFVNWCLNQAHISHAFSEISCSKWMSWLKQNRIFQNSLAYGGSYTPKTADFIFFNWDENNTTVGHIGFVLYVDTDKRQVVTVEGNSLDRVRSNVYDLDAPCIVGYGTPNYNEGSVALPDYNHKNGVLPGTYIVGERNIKLAAEAKSRKNIAHVPVGTVVEVLNTEDSKKALVRYEDKEGYIPYDVLYLIQPYATVTFTCDGKVVQKIGYDPTAKTFKLSLPEPSVPEKAGYAGVWSSYTLNGNDLTVNASYIPGAYTLTFIAEGAIVSRLAYTKGSAHPDLPDVPQKDGYAGVWQSFSFDDITSDITVYAVYTPLGTAENTDPANPSEQNTAAEDMSADGENSDGTGDDPAVSTGTAVTDGCASSAVPTVILPLALTLSATGLVTLRRRKDR